MGSDFETVYAGDDRAEWLRLRRLAICASESPAVLCEKSYTYQSNVGVLAEKIDPEPPVDEEDSERAHWGKLLEPVILSEFARCTSRHVFAAGELLRSTRWPFLQCTLDGKQREVATDRDWFPVEAKNTRASDMWADGIPAHVWIQIQHQLAVTGKPWGSVAVLLWGSEFKHQDVPRDDEFINEQLVPRCEEFWKLVQAGGPPPTPTGHPDTTKALAKIFPDTTEETVVLPGEFTDMSNELAMLTKASSANKTRADEIKNLIRAEMGEASYATTPSGATCSWKADVNGVRTFLHKPGGK